MPPVIESRHKDDRHPSSPEVRSPQPRVKKRRWALVGFVVLIVAATVAGRLLDVPDVVRSAQETMREAGPWAPAAFIGVYVVATLLGVPGTPLTLACALMFGFWKALGIMIVATTLASSAAFLLARYVAREAIERWLGEDSRLQKAKRWVEHSPWLAIPFLRMVPVLPYAINNYGLGLTRTPFWTYLIASELGMVPVNALFVGSANTLYVFAVRGETPWWMLAATAGAGVAILLFGWLGKRMFGRR